MNISKKTLAYLESEGFKIGFYDEYLNNVSVENATEISVTRIVDETVEFLGETVKTPKKKEVTVSWLMDKLYKKTAFNNLSEYVKTMLKGSNLYVHATSYGIGIESMFGKDSESEAKVRELLESNGIKYSNEFSDAHWVYRFKISKSSENVLRLKAITG